MELYCPTISISLALRSAVEGINAIVLLGVCVCVCEGVCEGVGVCISDNFALLWFVSSGTLSELGVEMTFEFHTHTCTHACTEELMETSKTL